MHAVSGPLLNDVTHAIGEEQRGTRRGRHSIFQGLAFLVPASRSARSVGPGPHQGICLLIAGWMMTRKYQASSRRRPLTPWNYPLFLAVCAATYVIHTVQNFRFIDELPSLAFFSVAIYLIYPRTNWAWFVLLFLVATTNRETKLLLLPLYMIDAAVVGARFQWRLLLQR